MENEISRQEIFKNLMTFKGDLTPNQLKHLEDLVREGKYDTFLECEGDSLKKTVVFTSMLKQKISHLEYMRMRYIVGLVEEEKYNEAYRSLMRHTMELEDNKQP